jgi:HK97 family phage major capsid protein
MAVEAKDLADKGQNVFALLQSYLDEKLGPIRTEVESVKSQCSPLDGEDKQIIINLQKEVSEVKKQFDMLQVAMNRPGIDNNNKNVLNVAGDNLERKAAFNKLLHTTSVNGLSTEERKHIQFDQDAGIETKALYVSEAGGGGFLTVPEYVNDMLKNIVLISPMPDIVEMRYTASPWVMTPRRTQTASAVRVAEQATRTETQNPRFGMVQNFPYESYAFTLVSRTDLEDSELDLGAFLMDEFAEQFAKLMGNEFINGLGAASSQAFGFLNDTTITNSGSGTVTTANSAAYDYKSLVKLKQSLKPGYLANATWVGTNETLGELQQLTDSQGRPLWVPFGGVLPDTLFGRPYRIMPDMPQGANEGGSSGALTLAFGDFQKGYQGVVRKQMSTQILNERYADQNAVGYFGYLRFGGTTKISEAIKTLRLKA